MRVRTLEQENRRQAMFHDNNPDIAVCDTVRPWNSVIRAAAGDKEFLEKKLEVKVTDLRDVRRMVRKSPGVIRKQRDALQGSAVKT